MSTYKSLVLSLFIVFSAGYLVAQDPDTEESGLRVTIPQKANLRGASDKAKDRKVNINDNKDASRSIIEGADKAGEDADREKKLAGYLNGCKFVGMFTVDGKEDANPKTEEYTISKCEKLLAKNMYKLTARIKYGDVDQEVPLELKILWAGNTPVITMDSFWIPGMGTFDARVMIRKGRYAGSWQHDEHGGHLFGKIVKD